MSTIADLKKGEKAIIESFTDFDTSQKLLEMGCIPGEEIVLDAIAPLGDPIAINVAGYRLSLRKTDASTVVVSLKN